MIFEQQQEDFYYYLISTVFFVFDSYALQIVRKYWPTSTRAMAFSGLSVDPIEGATCNVKNGGCSNTCIDSVGADRVCMCPDTMMLAGNVITTVLFVKSYILTYISLNIVNCI